MIIVIVIWRITNKLACLLQRNIYQKQVRINLGNYDRLTKTHQLTKRQTNQPTNQPRDVNEGSLGKLPITTQIKKKRAKIRKPSSSSLTCTISRLLLGYVYFVMILLSGWHIFGRERTPMVKLYFGILF